MVKKNKLQTASKATLAASLIASTVVPYSITASAEAVTMTTATEVTAALNALNPTSADYVTSAEAVIAAYEALIPSEKGAITTANKNKITNHGRAIVIVQAIKDLPTEEDIKSIEEVAELKSIQSEITAIRAQHATVPSAVRTLIKNLATLTTLEKAITSRTTYLNNLPLLAGWFAAFEALPEKTVNLTGVTAEQFATYTDNQKYTTQDANAITAARTEYNKLTTALKRLIATDLPTLVAMEAQVKLQAPLDKAVLATKVQAFDALVTSLDATSETYVADVSSVNDAFNNLEAAVSVGITNATKTALTNHTVATAFITRINELPTPEVIEAATSKELATIESTVNNVRASYKAFLAIQRNYVSSHLPTLVAAENAVSLRKISIAYDSELTEWKSLGLQLAEFVLKDFTGVTAVDFGGLADEAKYSSENITMIKNARNAYTALSAGAKRYVTAEDLATLASHEDAAQAQANLQKAYEDAILEVNNFTAAITALGETISFTGITADNYEDEPTKKYDAQALQAIIDARALVADLSAPAVTLADSVIETLKKHEAAVLEQEGLIAAVAEAKLVVLQNAATAYTTSVNALDALTDAAAYIAAVDAIKADADLAEGVLALVSKATETKIKNHREAAKVVQKIAKFDATLVTDINAISADANNAQELLNAKKLNISDAVDAYGFLTASEKVLVGKINYSTLTGAQTAINEKQAKISQAAVLAPFKAKMDNLPGVAHKFTDFTYKTDKATITNFYGEADVAAIAAARTEFGKLSAVNQALTDIATLNTLLGELEASLEAQNTLFADIDGYTAIKTRVGAFETAVAALGGINSGTPLEFTGLTELAGGTPVYDNAQKTLITAAHDSYKEIAVNADPALNVATKYIDGDLVTKMDGFVNSLATQKNLEVATAEGVVAALKAKIESLNGLTDLTARETAINEAAVAYQAYETARDTAALTELASVKATLDNQVAAMPVMKQIAALNDGYTTVIASADMNPYIQAANTARQAYRALDSGSKGIVIATNLNTLTLYETAVNTKKAELVAAEQKTAAIAAALKDFNDAMTALGSMTSAELITYPAVPTGSALLNMTEPKGYANLAAIRTAIVAYEAAPAKFAEIDGADFATEIDADRKNLIEQLRTSVEQYDKLVEAYANKDAINAALGDWSTKSSVMNAYTVKYKVEAGAGEFPVITATNVDTTGFEPYTAAEKTAITEARAAYAALADNAEITKLQDYVGKADLQKLSDLENAVAAYDAAKTEKINNNKTTDFQELDDKITALAVAALDYLTNYQTAKGTYDAMSEAFKADFATAHADANTLLAKHVKVVAVMALITDAGTVEAIEATTTLAALETLATKTEAARTAFANLTDSLSYTDADIKALEDAIASKRQAFADAEAIKAWTTAYNNLPEFIDLKGVTYDQLDSVRTYLQQEIYNVKALRTIYEAYEAEVQGKVPGAQLTSLEALEADIARQTALETELALIDWTTAFNNLPTAKPDFSSITAENVTTESIGAVVNKYVVTDKALIDAAAAAYEGLTVSQEVKDSIAAAYATLGEHQVAWNLQEALQTALDLKLAAASEQEKLTAFTTALAALAPNDSSYVANFTTVEQAYNALVTANLIDRLTAEQTTSYANHAAAVPVVTAITNATNETAITAANTEASLNSIKTALENADAAYGALSETAQANVANYGKIATALQAVEAKLATLTQTAAISAWNTAYAQLPSTVLNFTDVTAATIGDAITYSTGEANKINALRSIYDGYAADVKGYVPPEQYTKLLAHEAALAKQKQLEFEAANAGAIAGVVKVWQDAYAALPAAIDTSTLTADNYAGFAKYGATIDELILAAETALADLTPEIQAIYVTVAQTESIAAIKTSLKDFNRVAQEVNGVTLALQAWNTAYGALPATAIDTTSLTVENYETFTKYPAGIEGLIATAELELSKLRAELKQKHVTTAQTDLIAALKASVADFNRIKQQIDAGVYLEVIAQIEVLTTATMADAPAIQTAYNALSAANKSKIATSLVQKLTNHVNAFNLLNRIAALPTVEVINAMNTTDELASVRKEITSIRTAYSTFASAARSYVTTYSSLTALESAITAKETQIASQDLLVTWSAAVADLPLLIDLSNFTADTYTGAEGYTEASELLITTARSEYNKLSATVKSIIEQADLDRLIALENDLTRQRDLEGAGATSKAAVFTSKVDALDPTVVDYVTNVDAIEVEFIALNKEVFAILTTATKNKVANHVKAVKIVNQINALDSLAFNSAAEIEAYKTAITAARGAYNALPSVQRSYVKNVSVLVGHEKNARKL